MKVSDLLENFDLTGNINKVYFRSITDDITSPYDITRVKAAAEFVQDNFRVTDWICDCDSPVGEHDPTDPMIIELSNLITELSDLPGAKQINICKTWTGKQNKKEIKINLGETNLPTFLADLQENILYCLNI